MAKATRMNSCRAIIAQTPIMRGLAISAMALVTVLAVSGCRTGDLSTFDLQRNTSWPIEGKILDSIDAVDVYADNALTVASGSGVAFRTKEITDGLVSMQFTMLPGNSITVHSRTTPHSDTVLQDPGISVTIRNNVVTVSPFTPSVSVPVNIQPNVPFIVEIENDGRWIDINVACTHIGRFETSRPSTQWVIVRSNDRASFTLVDPKFHPPFTEE